MAGLRTGDNVPNVVVTAVASTTALAPDAERTWQQLREGQSGIHTLDKLFVDEFDSPVRIGGVLQESFDEHLTRVELRRNSFMQKVSLVLSRRVWDSAGSPDVDTGRLMDSVGQGRGCTEELVVLYDSFLVVGSSPARPTFGHVGVHTRTVRGRAV
jgi:beta-ketoacyl ACP synthase